VVYKSINFKLSSNQYLWFRTGHFLYILIVNMSAVILFQRLVQHRLRTTNNTKYFTNKNAALKLRHIHYSKNLDFNSQALLYEPSGQKLL